MINSTVQCTMILLLLPAEFCRNSSPHLTPVLPDFKQKHAQGFRFHPPILRALGNYLSLPSLISTLSRPSLFLCASPRAFSHATVLKQVTM